MACENDKNVTLFVGWLNVILSIAVPLGQFLQFMYLHEYELQVVYYDEYYLQLSMIYWACGFVTWLIVSLLLVKGIRQDRRGLMAPWICLSILFVISALSLMVYELVTIAKLGYGWEKVLKNCLPYAIVVVFLILSLIPIINMARKLSKPPLILPTQICMQAKQPEDDKRYMPLFDN